MFFSPKGRAAVLLVLIMGFLGRYDFEPLRLSKNRIIITVPGVVLSPPEAPRGGLQYFLDLYVEDGFNTSSFKLQSTLEMSEEPAVNGFSAGAFFDINERLDAELGSQMPDFKTLVTVNTDSVRKYYCVARVTNNGTEIYTEEYAVERVFFGGISEADFANWGTDFFTKKIGGEYGAHFLSNQPRAKINLKQDVLVSFLSNFLPLTGTVVVKRKITFTSIGNVQLVRESYIDSTVATIENVQPSTVYTINVGTRDKDYVNSHFYKS